MRWWLRTGILGTNHLDSDPQLCHLADVSHVTFLCLSFLVREMGDNDSPTSQGSCGDKY